MKKIIVATLVCLTFPSWAADESTSAKAIFDKALATARTISDPGTRASTSCQSQRPLTDIYLWALPFLLVLLLVVLLIAYVPELTLTLGGDTQ
jgi:TRAP-type mannitol/chloroaromatic compound transport system permease large subunit